MARIALQALSYRGREVDGPLAVFDEHGGSIGRADSNHLVLPDPERTVSRLHARIWWEDGCFTIEDCGLEPLQLNGLPLGGGRHAAPAPGDRLRLGGYALAVCDAALLSPTIETPAPMHGQRASQQPPQVRSPFDDLLGLNEPVVPAPRSSPAATGLPNALKAKMWDAFTELHARLSAEAAGDLPQLFSRDFLLAYKSSADQRENDR